jgi:site-specific DNA-adenine methylase
VKAPFPWFGGKSRVAHLVWDRFGNVPNYVEPFAGSLAVLLARAGGAGRNETVNDRDAYLSNFWRALAADPEQVTHFADWPVNEADLHARHRWLVDQLEFREKMLTDPDFYDAKIAGWWVWGISQWIGSGWCQNPDWTGRMGCERAPRGIHRKLPALDRSVGREVNGIVAKRPQLKRGGNGVARSRHQPSNGVLWQTRPNLKGQGLNARQIPDISGDSGASGRGVFAGYADDLYSYMQALSDRLRRVRVCCGDWKRILGPSPTTCIGTTAVFLDPPYAAERSAVYNEDSYDVSQDVRAWAIEHGDDPKLRIALCGYEGEHEMPASWECVPWKANGGYANQKSERSNGRENAHNERIWFSPACFRPQERLFA